MRPRVLPPLPEDLHADMPSTRVLPPLPEDWCADMPSTRVFPPLPDDEDEDAPSPVLRIPLTRVLPPLPNELKDQLSTLPRVLPPLPMDDDVALSAVMRATPPQKLPPLPIDFGNGNPSTLPVSHTPKVLPPFPVDSDELPIPTANRLPPLPADSDDERDTPLHLANLNAQSPRPAGKLPPLPADFDEDDEPPRKRRRCESEEILPRDQSGHGSVSISSASSTRPPRKNPANFYRRLGDRREVDPRYFEVGFLISKITNY